MALTQRLEIRQSHALVMTPQLMQAIKLLQLSNLDLAAYVEGELERNPLLERAGEDEGERSAASREVSPDAARADWMQADRDQDQSSSPEQPAVDIDDVPPSDADAATSRAIHHSLYDRPTTPATHQHPTQPVGSNRGKLNAR